MKRQQSRSAVLPVVFTLWLLQVPHLGFAAETTTNSIAPTGLYVSRSELPERIMVDLETNGVYTAMTTGLGTNTQSGVWMWDATKRKFLLTPGTNSSAFKYELRVLMVDPRQEHTLRWIPRRGVGPMAGTIDYVRFKRVDD